MPSLQTSYDWAIATCADPNVGYSQETRYGNPNYDCSSFISAALWAGGFLDWCGTNPWFRTYDMDRQYQYLQKSGFTAHPECVGGFNGTNGAQGVCTDGNYGAWLPGDILIRYTDYFKWGNTTYYEHTEMVYEGHRTMGAHSADHAFVDQVSINDWDADPNVWSNLLRYEEGSVSGDPLTPENFTWTNKSGYQWCYTESYLSFDRTSVEAETNAKIIFWYCYSDDNNWCRNAIYALLGNIQAECGMNPHRTEDGVSDPGYGLVQWTPKSVLENHATAIYGQSMDVSDGDVQMNVLFGEYFQTNGDLDFTTNDPTFFGEWILQDPSQWEGCDLSNTPYTSWYDWAHDNTVDVETKTRQFMCFYLRPRYAQTTNHIDVRIDNAFYWAEELASYTPSTSGGQGVTGTTTVDTIYRNKKRIIVSSPKIVVRRV